MLQPEAFLRRWETGPFSRLQSAAAMRLNLPRKAQEFLVEAGLPQSTGFYDVRFDFPPEGLPMLSVRWRGKSALPEEVARCRYLGSNEVTSICVMEDSSGRVVTVTRGEPLTLGFLNSSIPQMAEAFLVWRESTARLMENDTVETIETVADDLERALRRIDAQALASPEYGWAQVLEDLLNLF